MLVHLVGAVPVIGVLAAIVVWVMGKDEQPLVEANGKAAINFQLTLAGAYFALVILEGISFGVLAVVTRPVGFLLWLAALALVTLAARAAATGELYAYPLALRPLR